MPRPSGSVHRPARARRSGFTPLTWRPSTWKQPAVGSTCPLAKRGYNRDGKRGYLQVNYGLLTDPRGCPVAVSVHDGNTNDCETFLPQLQRLRQDFGIEQLVTVGDRGMISQKSIDEIRQPTASIGLPHSRAARSDADR